MSLAANRHYDGEAPQALLVTGVGSVNGREVMVIANDSSLKGGAWYPITTRKIVRALEIALENRLPVIHMLDCGGANLHLQDEIYAWAGHIFKQQCQLSARGIPQLAMVFGYCTAGAAYTPTLCDQTIMVRGRGAIFLGRAAAGQGRHRRGRHDRGARRRRHAHLGLGRGRLRRRHRGRGAGAGA